MAMIEHEGEGWERKFPTYIESQLPTDSFSVIRRDGEKELVLLINGKEIKFSCGCADFPRQKALGCPLHHPGWPGGSWPVEDTKNKIREALHPQNNPSQTT